MKLKRITETTKKLEGLTGELGLVSLLKKGLQQREKIFAMDVKKTLLYVTYQTSVKVISL